MSLADLMFERDLNDTQLSRLSGVSRTAIQRYRTGERSTVTMQLGTAVKLAEALGCEPVDLLP